MDILFYLDWVALGVIIGCQYNMVLSSMRVYRHHKDEKFPRCVKNFITWVAAGTVAGVWLLLSHYGLK